MFPLFLQVTWEAGERVKTASPGIYRVTGITKLPFQIVITGELEGGAYAAYRALTDKAQEADVERVIENLESEPNDQIREYYGMFLSLVAEKNPDVFAELRRENDMKYAGLMKVFEDEVNEKVRNAEAVKEQETTVLHIRDIMESFGVTIEKAMDSLKIPQADRAVYAGLVQDKL